MGLGDIGSQEEGSRRMWKMKTRSPASAPGNTSGP